MSGFNSLTEKEKCNEIMYMVRGQLSSNFRNKSDATEIINYIKYIMKSKYGLDVNDNNKSGEKATVRMIQTSEETSKHRRKTEDEKKEIQNLLNKGFSYNQISKELGVTRRTVARIANASK